MIQQLAGLCACVLAAFAAGTAEAQIILGGQPVNTAPGEAAPAARTFPVDTDQADYKPLVIAAPGLSGTSEEEKALAAQITGVIRSDLASLGIFSAADPAATSTFSANVDTLPGWAEWGGAGVDVLVLGKVGITGTQVNLQLRAYDIVTRKQVTGTQFSMQDTVSWRRLAHMTADAVMIAIVGGQGGFDSRIAYVAESAGKSQLAFITADAGWTDVIPTPIAGIESPNQSRFGESLIYSADAPMPGKASQSQRTTILYDLPTGRREPLTTGAQPNADARHPLLFSDASIVYSRKAGANTDIYRLGLAQRKETRLTDDPASDTEPSLSPDSSKFVFVSDRGGAAQIHLANVDGSPVTCANGAQAKACSLTPDGGGYSAPTWSPRGDWIAFVRRTGATSAIYIVRPDGSGLRALTTPGAGTLDLSPTWSPEGRRIAFSRILGDKSHLALVTLAGGEPQKIETGGNAFDPDWGPPLR